MIQTIDDITQIVSKLPTEQRYTLAQRILASVEPASNQDLNNAWTSEISERIRRYDANETKSIPALQVFAEIDKCLTR